MKKEFKIEISKITLGVLITGIFSLFSISILNLYTSKNEIFEKLELRYEYLKKEEDNLLKLTRTFEDLDSIPIESLNRLTILKDSINLKPDIIPSKLEINKYLHISSKSRFEITESIGLIDKQDLVSNFYITNEEILTSLRNMLISENGVWESLNNYILNINKDDQSQNELLFLQIDYNLLKWRQFQNKHSQQFVKLIRNEKNIDNEKNKIDGQLVSSIEQSERIRTYSLIGLIISIILIIPILKITIKRIRKR